MPVGGKFFIYHNAGLGAVTAGLGVDFGGTCGMVTADVGTGNLSARAAETPAVHLMAVEV